MSDRILYGNRIIKGSLTAESLSIDGAFNFPNVDGLANQVLVTDGNGNLSWQNISGTSVTSVNGQTGAVSLGLSDVLNVSNNSNSDIIIDDTFSIIFNSLSGILIDSNGKFNVIIGSETSIESDIPLKLTNTTSNVSITLDTVSSINNGLIEYTGTGNDIPSIDAGSNKILTSKEWVLSKLSGVQNRAITLTAGSDKNNVTNSYLNGPGGATNLSPLVVPFNGILNIASVKCATTNTFNIEVKVNGSTVYTLNVVSSTKLYNNTLTISINAGDEISIYCNGSGVNRPNVMLYIVEN